MLQYSVNKADVAQFVSNLLKVFGSVLPSITITNPEKSADCSVLCVINTESVDAVKEWTFNTYGWRQIT